MNQIYVATKCPHCERRSQFPIELLGLKSACRHCAKSMTVRDADGSLASQADSMAWWLQFTSAGKMLSPACELPEKVLPR